MNRKRVIDHLVRVSETSRSELARVTNLSRPTISAIVDDLLREGIVEELGRGASVGGRRPIRLRLKGTCGYVIGIDVGGTNITGGLADLRGRVIISRTIPTLIQEGAEVTFERVKKLVGQLVQEAGVNPARLLAIGLGSPGLVDARAKTTELTSNLPGWDDLGVIKRLERAFDVPVIADNDVNMAAQAELVLGVGQEAKSFIFVAIGTGIGAGIVLNGSLYQGYHGAAGEVHRMVLDRDALDPKYQEKGYLETIVGGPGIYEQAVRETASQSPPEELLREGAAAVFAAARAGEAWAKPVVEKVIRTLGMALANMACLLAPEVIVLGGGVAQDNELLRAGVEEIVKKVPVYPPKIVLSGLGKNAAMLGAVHAALNVVYQGISQSQWERSG